MLKSQLGLAPRIFARLVASEVAAGRLADRQSTLALPSHEVRFDIKTQAAIDQLFKRFESDPHAPPSARECRDAVSDEAFNALKELGELISVSPDVVFRTADYDAMVAMIRDRLEVKGTITLAEVRDLLHTSRRYAQALLEHLDVIGLTRREGESRRPGAAWPQR
jgi:selenocysteine-specific elongation factor